MCGNYIVTLYTGNNSCQMNNCSHICLMTRENELGYSCACPYGFGLETNGFECKGTHTYAVIIFYSIHKLFVLYTVLEGSGSGSGLVEPLPEEGMLLKLLFLSLYIFHISRVLY